MFRNCPSEICEIASMAMELFVSDDLGRIGCSPVQITDALQAKTFHDLGFLPYMSKIDLFQQRLYDNPTHSVAERHEQWRQLNERYPASMRTHSTASWA
jgi:oligoendopeptidase F